MGKTLKMLQEGTTVQVKDHSILVKTSLLNADCNNTCCYYVFLNLTHFFEISFKYSFVFLNKYKIHEL